MAARKHLDNRFWVFYRHRKYRYTYTHSLITGVEEVVGTHT